MTAIAHGRSRLPRWAQSELERLEKNLRYVIRERDAILQGASASPRIEVGTGPVGGPLGFLPADWRVRFVFGERHGHHFEARLDGEMLHLSAGGVLVVRPAAANLVYCGVES